MRWLLLIIFFVEWFHGVVVKVKVVENTFARFVLLTEGPGIVLNSQSMADSSDLAHEIADSLDLAHEIADCLHLAHESRIGVLFLFVSRSKK